MKKYFVKMLTLKYWSKHRRNRTLTLKCWSKHRRNDMTVVEVAQRCGAGTRNNLYFSYERDLNTAPTARRDQLRKDGDLGLYKIEK